MWCTARRPAACRLPPGAQCLASSDFEPHHAFRFGEAAWGVQFHPEFDTVAMKCYIAQLSSRLRQGGANPDALTAAVADPLFAELPDVFHAQAVHRQTAVRLPPGAECLARNDFEPHHAFRFGEAAWGVQFHPEFDAFAMRGYIRHLADALRNDGADPEALARTVTDTPAAAAILARFGRFVIERSVGMRA